jgi:hypothetical protein
MPERESRCGHNRDRAAPRLQEDQYSAAVLEKIARNYASGGDGPLQMESTDAGMPSGPTSAEPDATVSMDHGERMTSLLEANSSALRRSMMVRRLHRDAPPDQMMCS